MSILAEPRRKQKISVDPQNQSWIRDEGKYGKKLMEKMGWTSGKGLGKTESGMADNIKLNPNTDSRGLGSDGRGYDHVWIEHQDNFNALLEQLNSQVAAVAPVGKEPKSFNLEEISKKSRARIHYHKFTRGKDLSSKSADDLACIVPVVHGKSKLKKLKMDKSVEEEQAKTENGVKTEVSDETTLSPAKETFNGTVSKESTTDYFSRRMAELKAKAQITVQTEETVATIESSLEAADPVVEEAPSAENENATKSEKKKKRKRDASPSPVTEEIPEPVLETENDPKLEENEIIAAEEPKKKKKSKKEKQEPVEEIQETSEVLTSEPTEGVEEKRKKRKKSKREDAVEG
jgi:Pin2-interacting protein X1